MVGELDEVLEPIEDAGEVRAMVLTGVGDRALC
jgi:enoyl-CoA hydratase/carnithine racemase